MMFTRVMLLLFVCCLLTSTIRIGVYKDAQFVPTNTNLKLADLFSIRARDECICQCLANSKCITATYIGINKSCSLFSTQVKVNWLQKMANITNASVITFANESLPGKSRLAVFHEMKI